MDTRVRSTSETSQVVERTGFDVVGLEIRAGERLLVGPLDFSLERGEGLVVVGQMATGKSLLVESLVGFRRPGTRFTGRFGFRGAAGQPLTGRTSLCPQDWRLGALPTDQVHTLLRGHGPRAPEVLEQLEVDVERVGRLGPTALSAGERLRVLLACAVADDADLLLIDGAADVLDPRLRALVAGLMEAELSRGKMIIATSRDASHWTPGSLRRVEVGPALGGDVVAVPLVPKRPETTRAVASAPALAVSDLDVERQRAGLWRRGKAALVVDDASLFVRKGEILVLLGPSGAGKTSLLRTMAGQLPAQSGRVRVSGVDVALGRGRSGPTKRAVQLVSAEVARGLDPSLTVAEQLRRALPRTQSDTVVPWLERLGLSPLLADQSPDVLSEGEGFRLSLALALTREPKVLLLDAPRSGALDTDGGTLTSLVLAEKAQGKSFVLATTDPGVSRSLADRIAILDAGRILEFGPTALLLTKPAHPRTRALLRSQPGPAHDPRSPRPACHMAGACPNELERCSTERPPLDFVPGTTRNHRTACFNPNLDTIDEDGGDAW